MPAQSLGVGSHSLGFVWSDSATSPGVLDYAMSSTTTYKLGISTMLKENEIPDTAYVYLAANNTVNISAEWQTNDVSNGRPSGTKVTNSNTVTVTAPTAGVMTISGLKGTATGTAGQILWLVFNTPSGTPTGSIRLSTAKCAEYRLSGYRTGNNRASYTTSWATTTIGHLGLMVLYASGNTDGYVVSGCGVTTDKIYGTDEDGCCFISPDCWIEASGVHASLKRTGTTFSPLFSFNMRVNGALYSTAVAGDYGAVSTATISICLPFVNPIRIPPRSKVVVTAVNSGGSSSDYLYLGKLAVPATVGSVNMAAIRPCEGSFYRASYISSTWSYTTTDIPFMALILSQGKGVLPSPINRRQFNALR